jgi:murein L,D-transpeptidase YafK
MKKILITILIILVAILFVKYGRSIYMPIINKIKGSETVESVIEKIHNQAAERLKNELLAAGFENEFPDELIFVGLKKERIFQVYAKNSEGTKLIKEYPFTAFSGELGPKLKEGDKQIPEGIYHIEYLNPNSSYYLSMKVSYPNEFDISKSEFSNVKDLGTNIFIHGKSSSIGCIAIGDEAIEEVFLLTHHAINKGIKVIISPQDFRQDESYPNIKSIDWEAELYDQIKTELLRL